MKKEQIQLCLKLIYEHNSLTEEKEKNKTRNKIYLEVQPDIAKWIPSILSRKNFFLSQEEILSLSWDCFEFCLKHFKTNKEITIPSHFYTYTRFYLLMYYVKKDFFNSSENEEVEIESPIKLYEYLDELKSFRSILDAEYVSIFDDAIMSLFPGNKYKQIPTKEDKVGRKILDIKSSLTHSQYRESKKIFKIVIDYLLRR